jgi:hypothetical protein
MEGRGKRGEHGILCQAQERSIINTVHVHTRLTNESVTGMAGRSPGYGPFVLRRRLVPDRLAWLPFTAGGGIGYDHEAERQEISAVSQKSRD